MTLSARRLGEKCGLTAEEMNFLLKEEGYLSGEPGDYYLTEKGSCFAIEKSNDNGYGGSARRAWVWFEWDEGILDNLDVSQEHKQYIREKTAEARRRRRAISVAAAEPEAANENNVQSEEDVSINANSNFPILGLLALIGCGIGTFVKHHVKKNRHK